MSMKISTLLTLLLSHYLLNPISKIGYPFLNNNDDDMVDQQNKDLPPKRDINKN